MGINRKLTRRQWILVAAAATAAVIAVVFLTWIASLPIRSERLKDAVIALLTDELESEVTIQRLEGRILPRVAVSGGGVVIRQRGRTDVPPLLKIEGFEIRGNFRDLISRPRRVAELRLRGLEVNIPPGRDGRESSERKADRYASVVIDRFEAPNTVITLIPRRPGKPPKVFTVHHLVMESVGTTQTIPYSATLTNPVPKGQIETSGTFGPWNVADPSQTPVKGKYVFANVNLDTIEGLAGSLTSDGEFGGPLNRIEVRGTTASENFQIDVGGAGVPLHTRFTAIVDGSNGDTYLENVNAKLLDSELVAKGAVVGLEGVRGRRIEVDVTMPNGRIEDLLQLAMKSSKPLLVGAAQLQAKLLIPPEKRNVIDKMSLRGSFGLTQARFTDRTVQSRLAGLSRRGQGKGKDDAAGEVLSNLRGRFTVENSVVSFSRLTFGVPGAEVRLAGRYGLRSESLQFRGHLRMQAPLSEVAGGGVKGFFLKVFDPFFRKPGAGMELPIRITGSRKDPKFGLDLFRDK